MNIVEIKEQVERAMEDKQEFADLCFKLVPKLIGELENLEDTKYRLSDAESLLYEAQSLMSDVHCYDTDTYRAISRYFNGDEEEEWEDEE